jgi:hypothetical protein
MVRLRVPEGKEYCIHGHVYRAGDEFDAPEKEAQLWKITGLAEDASTASSSFRRRGRPPKPEPEIKEPARYERKDMRAQDE